MRPKKGSEIGGEFVEREGTPVFFPIYFFSFFFGPFFFCLLFFGASEASAGVFPEMPSADCGGDLAIAFDRRCFGHFWCHPIHRFLCSSPVRGCTRGGAVVSLRDRIYLSAENGI